MVRCERGVGGLAGFVGVASVGICARVGTIVRTNARFTHLLLRPPRRCSLSPDSGS